MLYLSYKEMMDLLHTLEVEYVEKAKDPTNQNKKMDHFGVYAIRRVRKEINEKIKDKYGRS